VDSGILAEINDANPVVLPDEKVKDKKDPSIYYYEHLPYASFSSYEGQRVLGLRSFYMYMTRETGKALDDMLYDFIVATGGFSAENAVRVGKPLLFKAFDESDLTSEFALGTTVHLKVVDGSSTLTFSEADGYTWIYENAHKYGFIVRYPESKSDQTGVSGYEHCFRYVGVPHATYITQSNLCLEEYVELLKNNYTSTHLAIKGADGNSYEVYYVPAGSGDITTISVPSNYEYTVSGDNVSGFIVTVHLNEPKA
jgi:hypothetical protein